MSARDSMTGFLACEQQLSVRIPLAVHQCLTHPLRCTSNPGTPATTSAGVSYRRRFIPAAGRRSELVGCLDVFSPTAGSRLSARLCEPSGGPLRAVTQSVSQSVSVPRRLVAPPPSWLWWEPAVPVAVVALARLRARERAHTHTRRLSTGVTCITVTSYCSHSLQHF